MRADVSRLPFASGSVDAVHAGAALHCWPSPSNAVTSLPLIPLRNCEYLYEVFTKFCKASFSDS